MLGLDDPFSRLETILEAGGMAWWEMELPSGVVIFSENRARMLGYASKEFTHYSSFTALLHKDDYSKTMQAMQDHLDGKKDTYEILHRLKHKNGSYRQFYERGKIVSRDNGETRIAGISVDITGLLKKSIDQSRR